MKPRHRRGLAIVVGLLALGIGERAGAQRACAATSCSSSARAQVAANEAPRERGFRIGGLVEQGSRAARRATG